MNATQHRCQETRGLELGGRRQKKVPRALGLTKWVAPQAAPAVSAGKRRETLRALYFTSQ